MQTLQQTLALLAQGAGTGAVLAFLLEKVPAFQNLSSNVKLYTTLAVSLALPLLATLALQYVPVEVWAQLEPYWQALALGFLTWAGSQAVHKLDVRVA